MYTFNNWYTHSNFKKFYTQNFVVKFSPHSTLLALGRLHLFQDNHNFEIILKKFDIKYLKCQFEFVSVINLTCNTCVIIQPKFLAFK